MSELNLSGPQLVSARAQQITECPYSGEALEEFWDEFEPCNHAYDAPRRPTAAEMEAERVNRFALAKVITDELARRLPNMTRKYPPYGLQDLHRDSRTDTLERLPITELEPDPESDNRLDGLLASINRAYASKVNVHFLDELEAMHHDPRFGQAVSELSIHRTPNYHVNTKSTHIEAYYRLEAPVENALDTILGTFRIAPAVFERQFGLVPSHDETIVLLRNSRRLPIIPSLLAQPQLQSFIIGTTEPPHMSAERYGYNFRTDVFSIEEMRDPKQGLVMDFAGGIGSVAIPGYSLDRGELQDAYIPEIIINPDGPSQELKAVKLDRATLTCPARKFIAAMYADLVDIADHARAFDPSAP